MNDSISIGELARRTGVSVHTLRYYEKAGLMIPVPRDRLGCRAYTSDHTRWVSFLLRLREGGMGIAQLRRYAELTRSNTDPDGAQRTALLSAHRDQLRERVRRLTQHLEVLDRKIAAGCRVDDPSPGEGSTGA